jgi:hypothetical protein
MKVSTRGQGESPTIIQLDGNSIGMLVGSSLNYVCQVVAQAAFEPCENTNSSYYPKKGGLDLAGGATAD